MEGERPREPMEPPGLGRKTILSVRISVDKCGLVVKNAALFLINHLSSLIDTYGTIFYRATAAARRLQGGRWRAEKLSFLSGLV